MVSYRQSIQFAIYLTCDGTVGAACDAICRVSCGTALSIVPPVLAPLVASLRALFLVSLPAALDIKCHLKGSRPFVKPNNFGHINLPVWIRSFNASFVDSGHHLVIFCCWPQNRQTNGQAVNWSLLIQTPLPVNFETLRVIAVIKWRRTVADHTRHLARRGLEIITSCQLMQEIDTGNAWNLGYMLSSKSVPTGLVSYNG